MRKFLPALLAAAALGGIAGFSVAHRAAPARPGLQERRIALLEEENARLREAVSAGEKTRAQSENVTKRAEIERAVTGLRELPFQKPVAYAVLTRAGIRRVIAGKISEQMSDAEIQNAAAALAAFGLLPKNYPLKQKYIELLGEQVAAFYDQHAHQLFMFEDAALSNGQNRVILAHELTHALQDQHFGLAKLPLEIRDNDDRAAAASALIEGDATLLMTQYMAQNISAQTLRDTLAGAVTQNTGQIRQAPRYLREMLVFPYLRGQEFCAALYARGGWPAVDAAYKNPPSSTSEILHPEKFPAEPAGIGFGDDLTALGEKPLADNVLGEMGIRILFSENAGAGSGAQAGAGWRGDRYLVFQNGDALVWKTAWESESAAGAFMQAAEQWQENWNRKPQPGAARWMQMRRLPGNAVVLAAAKTEESGRLLLEKFAR